MHGFLVQQSALRAPVDTYRGALYPTQHIHFLFHLRLHIDLRRYMVPETTRIRLRQEISL